nr:hypothetical protein [Planifilum fimeticola]
MAAVTPDIDVHPNFFDAVRDAHPFGNFVPKLHPASPGLHLPRGGEDAMFGNPFLKCLHPFLAIYVQGEHPVYFPHRNADIGMWVLRPQLPNDFRIVRAFLHPITGYRVFSYAFLTLGSAARATLIGRPV